MSPKMFDPLLELCSTRAHLNKRLAESFGGDDSSTIPMQNLTAPGDWNRQNSALKHFNWSEGCFKFHFIDADTTDGGPSEWEDYQAYRRILGAIGIVHLPSCEGAGFRELETQYRTVVAQHKHIYVQRIFAFGHTFEQGATEVLDTQRDIIFPPEQEFEDGGSTTELHMGVNLYDVAVSLIKGLAADVKTWNATTLLNPSAAGRAVAVFRGNNAEMPALTSRYDREEGVSESKIAKRRPGRLQKWIGDTCLLAGSPKDALEHYSQSMSDTKASSDPLWHAGCLEGFAACLAAMSDADHPTVHGDQALALLREMTREKDVERTGLSTQSTWTILAEAVVTEKCSEALTVLSRYPALGALEVELCFKTARFHACAQPYPRWGKALTMLLRALSVPEMPMQVQLERSIEAAILCEGMGLKRKAALFAHLSAMLCSDFENWQTAHLLARVAAEGYGVHVAPALPSVPRGPSTFGGEAEGGWVVLQKHLLQWLLAVSARCGDANASSSYFAGLTRLMASLEGERSKADRYMVTLPAPPSDSPRKDGPAPIPLVMDALGNNAGGPIAPIITATKDSVGSTSTKFSWHERMMRRATTSAPEMAPAPLPPTPSGPGSGFNAGMAGEDGGSGDGGGVGGGSAGGASGGVSDLPLAPAAPMSPIQQRIENFASDIIQAAQPSSAKKSRKISLPKSIGRKLISARNPPQVAPLQTASSTKDFFVVPPAAAPQQALSSAGDSSSLSTAGGVGGACSSSSTSAVAHRASLTREEQWETLVEMGQCSTRLSPEDTAKIQLQGIPRLESARLLHVDGPLALLPGDGSAASTSSNPSARRGPPPSAFFYNPFDTSANDADGSGAGGSGEKGSAGSSRGGGGGEGGRRGTGGAKSGGGSSGGAAGSGRGGRRSGRGGDRRAEVPARWAAGETGKVVARLSNPLRVPLEVTSVKAVLDGGKVQAFPTSVVLPPKAEFHEVILFVKPLEDGVLVLRGVSMEVFSLVTLCRVDKWGRGVSVRPMMPSPRTYKALAAAFRRPPPSDKNALTVETVDISTVAEAAAAAEESTLHEGEGDGVGDTVESTGSEGIGAVTGGSGVATGVGAGAEEGEGDVPPKLTEGGAATTEAPGAAKVEGGVVPTAPASASSITPGAAAGGAEQDVKEIKAAETGPGGVAGGLDGSSKVKESLTENEREEDEEEYDNGMGEFVPDRYMRPDEAARKKLKVESATPLLKLSRPSQPNTEALAGEEIEERMELVNQGSGPTVGVIEVWTGPSPVKSTVSMTLLGSLSGSSCGGANLCGVRSKSASSPPKTTTTSPTLEVTLVNPLKVSGILGDRGRDEQAGSKAVPPGARVELALRQRAGEADSDHDALAEVLVKYSEKVGATHHRQLRLPLRLTVRGGLRVCSLRVAQFLGCGLSLSSDTDATECLLLLELANDSPFPIFAWRDADLVSSGHDGASVGNGPVANGCGGNGRSNVPPGVTDIAGRSRRCLCLRMQRLRVAPEGKGKDDDEPRSPIAVRALYEWEKSLLEHLHRELCIRWATEPASILVEGGVETGGDKGNPWASGRRGVVAMSLDRLDDDGCMRASQESGLRASSDKRSPPPQQSGGGGGSSNWGGIGVQSGSRSPTNEPQVIPACLMGGLLPPVRLTCLPFAYIPPSRNGSKAGRAQEVGVAALDIEAFPKLSVSEAGEVDVIGKGFGGDVEGAWAVRTSVASFVPVAILVHNPSPWPVEVEVEVTTTETGTAEARGEIGAGEDDEDGIDKARASCDSRHVMWAGLLSRRLGKVGPGMSVCHGLVGCFLSPGEFSVGFTCRVKIESASAPYGSMKATSTRSGQEAAGEAGTEEGCGWHPVLCHHPLAVSVFVQGSAGSAGTGVQVSRAGSRIGRALAYGDSSGQNTPNGVTVGELVPNGTQ